MKHNRTITTREHLSKHDREIDGIRKLITPGMKMLSRSQEQIAQTGEQLLRLSKEVRRLAAAQKRTDAVLPALIERGSGHGKRKVDLQ